MMYCGGMVSPQPSFCNVSDMSASISGLYAYPAHFETLDIPFGVRIYVKSVIKKE